MDLSTVQKKLDEHIYKTTNQFSRDVELIWENSFKYNQKGSEIYNYTTFMRNFF